MSVESAVVIEDLGPPSSDNSASSKHDKNKCAEPELKSLCENDVDSNKVKIYCEFCPRFFYFYQSYRRHITTDHTKNLPYRCEVCWECYPTVRQLLDHKKETHDNSVKIVKPVVYSRTAKHSAKNVASVSKQVASCSTNTTINKEPRFNYNSVLLPEFSSIIQETVESARKMLQDNPGIAESSVEIKTEIKSEPCWW